jgi:RNA-directed DNA polymerase
MKRVGNLYEKIISLENLRLADIKARKGKSHSHGVIVHDKNREQNIIDLHEKLKNKEYKTSEYHVFTIKEPKEREIYRLPYYPDRIVHHAVMNVLEEIWVKTFTTDTYSCIKERGIHGVVRKLKADLIDEENTQYCLKIDIRKYYPSINHDVLKKIVRKKIKDKDLLCLLDQVIDSAEGLPIGNYLSQYFANLYLTYFDHWIKEDKRIKYYYRYADDMVFLSKDKESLHTLFSDIEKYLKDELKLEIKGNYQIFPVDKRGLDFVGYVFRHTHILLRKSIKKSFAKAAKKNKCSTYHDIKTKCCSYFGWAIHCNSVNLLNKLKTVAQHEEI